MVWEEVDSVLVVRDGNFDPVTRISRALRSSERIPALIFRRVYMETKLPNV